MKQNESVYLPSYIAYQHDDEGNGEPVSSYIYNIYIVLAYFTFS